MSSEIRMIYSTYACAVKVLTPISITIVITLKTLPLFTHGRQIGTSIRYIWVCLCLLTYGHNRSSRILITNLFIIDLGIC